ncbi:MAG TPA: glycosyltransferase family 4 protein [Thermoanaerobaculia bacterium]|nr:glycosyltransferase family 4 protein [Thermoanaerobaculia bacterium]
MRILHLASGNRWTGAAAPAFAEVVALRQAGVDAHYAYVGGYKLQAKIGHYDFTHAMIPKAQNPWSFAGTVRAIDRLLEHHRFDIIHAHLTYDHMLERFAARGGAAKTARTFHSRRVIRSDPFTRALVAATDLIFVVNDSLADAPAIRKRAPLFTPPPLDSNAFRPQGEDIRERYAIPRDALLIAAIGKLAPGRGFELVLQTFAELHNTVAGARLMIIGHGEHRPALETLAAELGIAAQTTWAGYHEDDLPEHHRAADFLLFTSKGSDEGHRAVLEAMACGTVPVTVPLAGMSALLGSLAPRLMADGADPAALAARIADLRQANDLPARVVQRAMEFSYEPAARRLIGAYSAIL